MNIVNDLTEYISKIAKIPRNEIGLNTKIYNSGIISSLKLIELMAYIEKQFSIIIKPEELIEDNFKDISTIAEYIQSKV